MPLALVFIMGLVGYFAFSFIRLALIVHKDLCVSG